MHASRFSATALSLCLLLFAAVPSASAFYNIAPGDKVPQHRTRTLRGQVGTLLKPGAKAQVFCFLRPDQPQTPKTLAALGEVFDRYRKDGLHIVAIVSDAYKLSDISKVVKESGAKFPILIDVGNELYGKLGVMLTPTVGVVDAHGNLMAYLPFRQVNYGYSISAHVEFALGKLTQEQLHAVNHPAKATQGGDTAKAKRNLRLGEMLYRSKKWDKAASIAKKSLTYDAQFAPAMGLLAACLAHTEKCAEALPYATKALAIDAEDPNALSARTLCAGAAPAADAAQTAAAANGAATADAADPNSKVANKAGDTKKAGGTKKAKKRPRAGVKSKKPRNDTQRPE